MLYPPGYLCRIARMQASDHLGHPTKFRETGEEIATSCPQPRPLPYTLCLRDEAQATADDSVGMKATAGARKVNMADENSRCLSATQAISSRLYSLKPGFPRQACYLPRFSDQMTVDTIVLIRVRPRMH